jgi:hypothetical protein
VLSLTAVLTALPLSAVPAPGSPSSAEPAEPVSEVAAAPSGTDTDKDPSALLVALAWPPGDQVARVTFTEERQFPFRRFPKRFSGTLDRSPDGELILCYTQPVRERLLLLPEGIFFENADGQRRELSAEAGYVRVLRDLIGGDQEALLHDWRIEPRADGFTLYPKDPALDGSLKRVEVTVAEGRVRGVQVFLGDGVVRRYTFDQLTWVPLAQFGQPADTP